MGKQMIQGMVSLQTRLKGARPMAMRLLAATALATVLSGCAMRSLEDYISKPGWSNGAPPAQAGQAGGAAASNLAMPPPDVLAAEPADQYAPNATTGGNAPMAATAGNAANATTGGNAATAAGSGSSGSSTVEEAKARTGYTPQTAEIPTAAPGGEIDAAIAEDTNWVASIVDKGVDVKKSDGAFCSGILPGGTTALRPGQSYSVACNDGAMAKLSILGDGTGQIARPEGSFKVRLLRTQ